MMASTPVESTAARIEGRCDVCTMRDGKQGLNLQRCTKCGLCVHETCYGLETTVTKNFNFVCAPCASIGKAVIGARLKSNEPHQIKQIKRPAECALCSVDDGIHAMQPLFRENGPKGRQLILPAAEGKEERLAWVHSLCAQGLCSSRSALGSVYACDKWGRYQGEDGQMQGNDNAPDDDDAALATHHYVVCGTDGKTDAWTKAISQLRSQLKCIICGCNDKASIRIPIQCSAGDDDEFEENRRKHKDQVEPCSQSLHVGCAAWRPSGKFRQMCFYPGTSHGRVGDQYQDPVSEIYCPLHAKDIGVKAIIGISTKLPNALIPPVKPLKRKMEEACDISYSPNRKSHPRVPTLGSLPSHSLTMPLSRNAISKSALARRASDSEISKKSAPLDNFRRVSYTSAIGKSQNMQMLTPPLKKKSPSAAKSILNVGSFRSKAMPPPPPNLEPIERHSGGRVAHRSSLQRLSSMSHMKEMPTAERNAPSSIPIPQMGQKASSAPDSVMPMDMNPTMPNNMSSISSPFEVPPIRRRRLSESKTGENEDSSQDWYSTMVSDIGEIIEFSKLNGYDVAFMVSERRYYWKKKSGILSSSFTEIWKQICNHFENDLGENGYREETALRGSAVDDEASNPTSHLVSVEVNGAGNTNDKNKWSYLWEPDAALFDIGTWDSSGTFLKEKN